MSRHPRPRRAPPLALIGCGGISAVHLAACRAAGWPVVGLCSRERARADARRREFCPEAAVETDYRALLERTAAEVVIVCLHPGPSREEVVLAALAAGKDVLVEKPLSRDLAAAERLVGEARRRGRLLAVNFARRWSPHWAALLEACQAGRIGRVSGVHLEVRWDHDWIAGTPFDAEDDVALFDYGIHWFDLLARLTQGQVFRRVWAEAARAPGQRARPPLRARGELVGDGLLGSLALEGATRLAPTEVTRVDGEEGVLLSRGPRHEEQVLELVRPEGATRLATTGGWPEDAFQDSLGELLLAREEGRAPGHAAEACLPGLRLCLGALRSARSGRVEPLV